MGFGIGLLLGLVIAASVVYFLMSRKTSMQAAALKDLKQRLAAAEADHDRRLKVATERLRQDYEAQRQTAQASSLPPTAAPPQGKPSQTASASEPVVAANSPPAPQVPPPAPVARPTGMPPRSVDTLTADSYATEAAVRRQVTEDIEAVLPTLSATGKARLRPVLKRLARDPDPTVRQAAIQALAQLPAAQSLPLLQRALRDADTAVMATAHRVLSRLKGRSRSLRQSPRRRLPKNR